MTHGTSYFVSSGVLWRVNITPAASRNNLKVFGVDPGGIATSFIVRGPEADKFAPQLLLPIHIEGCERARHGTLVGAVELHHCFRWEAIVKVIDANCKLQIGNSFTETIANG
jgi:hypothetical protein